MKDDDYIKLLLVTNECVASYTRQRWQSIGLTYGCDWRTNIQTLPLNL